MQYSLPSTCSLPKLALFLFLAAVSLSSGFHFSRSTFRRTSMPCKQDITSTRSEVCDQGFGQFKKLPPWLVNRCHDLGYIEPTTVQKEALPVVLDGKDVILQAKTGSGKTLIYALSLLTHIDVTRCATQAIVIVPTRELAFQVAAVIKQLSSGNKKRLKVMPLLEGSSNSRQRAWVTADPPHIIVGNPKCMSDIVESGKLTVRNIHYVVVDEVDACFDDHETRRQLNFLLSHKLSSSFRDGDPEFVNSCIDAKVHQDYKVSHEKYHNNRQTIFCSATIPQRNHFAAQCAKNAWTNSNPILIHVEPKEPVPLSIEHHYLIGDMDFKYDALLYSLQQEAKAHHMVSKPFQALVFMDRSKDLEQLSDAFYSLQKSGAFYDSSKLIDIDDKHQRLLLGCNKILRKFHFLGNRTIGVSIFSEEMSISSRSESVNCLRSVEKYALMVHAAT